MYQVELIESTSFCQQCPRESGHMLLYGKFATTGRRFPINLSMKKDLVLTFAQLMAIYRV